MDRPLTLAPPALPSLTPAACRLSRSSLAFSDAVRTVHCERHVVLPDVKNAAGEEMTARFAAKPFRVLVCAARTLNAAGFRIGQLCSTTGEVKSSLGDMAGGRRADIGPETMLAGRLLPHVAQAHGAGLARVRRLPSISYQDRRMFGSRHQVEAP